MTEQAIQNSIREAVSPYCVIFRMNVGAVRTADGRIFRTGVPPGFSDLFGVRISDGRAVFIEVKNASGRVSPQQKNFIERMSEIGAIAGVCRSAEEALKLILQEEN